MNPARYNPSMALLSLTEEDVRRKGQQTGTVRFRSGSWYIKFNEWAFVDGAWQWRRTEKRIEDGGKDLSEKRALLLGYEQHVAPANQLNKTPQGLMDLESFVELRYKPDVVSKHGLVWRKSAESLLRVHVVPAFGKLQLGELRAAMVQEWVNAKEKTHSTKTVGECFKLLKSICDHAAAMSIEVPNLIGIKTPRVVSEERTAYTSDQIRQLAAKLVAINQPMWARFTIFLALTGLRRGEALGMRWRDIDFERGAASARGTWNLQEMTPGKGRAARRVVPLVDEAADILSRQLAMSKWTAPDNFIWTARNGKPANAANALRRLLKSARKGEKSIVEQLGMPDFDWHSERHSAISAADGVLTQAEKRDVFGHSSDRMSGRYTHPEFEAMKAKMEGKPN